MVRYLRGNEELAGSGVLAVTAGGTADRWRCSDVVRTGPVTLPLRLELAARGVSAAFELTPVLPEKVVALRVHTQESHATWNDTLAFAAVTGSLSTGEPVAMDVVAWNTEPPVGNNLSQELPVGGGQGFGYLFDARNKVTLTAVVETLSATAEIHPGTFSLD